MTARPHDALFKSAFGASAGAAALLRELLPSALRPAIAWETLEDEPGSFIDRRLADRHSDLLFSAELRAGEPGLAYLLLEHQSTGDETMVLRMLSAQLRIWDRFRQEHRGARLPPVIAVLVSHVPGGWTDARSLDDMLDPAVLRIPGLAALLPRFSIVTLDLADLSDEDLQARSLAPFQKLALWLLRDARAPSRLLAHFGAWRTVLRQAGRTRSGLDDLAVLIEYVFRVVEPMIAERFRVKLSKLGRGPREVAMTYAEYLEEQGRRKGLAQGRKRGLQEGCVATLRKQLLFKFRTLDAAHEARLRAATPAAIGHYLERVLTARSVAEVFAGGRRPARRSRVR